MGLLIRHTQCRCGKPVNSKDKSLFYFYYLGTRFELCESCFNVEMEKMEVLIKAGYKTDYESSEGDLPENN